MNKAKKAPKAFEILHRRYIGENAERQASLEIERVNAEVARSIYELRKKAGLTQRELAQMVDTTQSVISRLEDADYEGHSLSMLNRIAIALKRRLSVQMIEPENEREAAASADSPDSIFCRMALPTDNMAKELRPGQIAPLSGQYQQVGPRGGKGKAIEVAGGEPLPPTPRRNMTYRLVDPDRPVNVKEPAAKISPK